MTFNKEPNHHLALDSQETVVWEDFAADSWIATSTATSTSTSTS